MAFYIPSFIQKRILRYALSKFDIFDADALQPDRLDIAWGKRSSFELRDVGLRIERLSELLKLPSHAVIRAAKISRLRLTIPADIYNSGIQFEADGLYLDLFLDEDPTARKAGSDKNESEASTKVPSPASGQHDQFGEFAGPESKIFGAGIPASEALARSYLAAEPRQEKQQLQEALEQSQSLDHSVFSEYGSSDAGDGYGAPISLPIFVADFLEGVKNRAHAVIRDICLDVGTSLTLSATREPREVNAHREDVRLRFSLDELSVPVAQLNDRAGSGDHENRRPTTRSIRFTNARAALLSDPSLLDFLAQYSGPPSPVATHRSSFKPSSSTSSKKPETESTLPSPVATAQPTSPPHLQASIAPNVQDRYQEDLESSSPMLATSSSTHYVPSRALNLSANLSETVENSSDLLHSTVSEKNSPTDSEPSAQMFYSGLQGSAATEHVLGSSQESEGSDTAFHSQSSSLVSSQEGFDEAEDGLNRSIPPSVQQSTMIGPDSDIFNSFLAEDRRLEETFVHDLMESRIFSHEEAASLYQSAISTATDAGHAAMPGGWGDESPVLTRQPELEQRGSDWGHYNLGIRPGSSQDLEHEQKIIQQSRSERPSYVEPSKQESISPQPAPLPSPEAEFTEEPSNTSPIAPPLQDAKLSALPLLPSPSMLKEFLHLDMLTLHITENAPTASRNLAATTGNVNVQSSTILPTDVMTDSLASTGASTADIGSHQSYSDLPSHASGARSSTHIGIEMGNLELTIDMSFIRLALVAIQQIPLQTGDNTVSTDTTKNDQSTALQASIQKIHLRFVTALETKASSVKDASSEADGSPSSEVLLELKLEVIKYAKSIAKDYESQKLDIGTFTFGYANEPIISFDSAMRMRDSVRDNLAPVGNDVKIRFGRKTGTPGDITMTTASLCVKLDLTRLDELFAWFGGLSSVLELGNSMVSTMTVPEPRNKKARRTSQGRGVRFKTSNRDRSLSPHPDDQLSAKFTARIGGLNFVVIGSESAVNIDSTAIKIARRNEAIRVSIDKIRANGPYNTGLANEVVPTVWLDLLSITYLPAPTDDDLDRVLALLSPSKDRDEPKDEIILDTFLRQRRQGSIVRIAVKQCTGSVDDVAQLENLSQLGDDLKKLSNVAKYLPDDDRPGLLILGRIESTKLTVDPGKGIGAFNLSLDCTELAQVTLPSLLLVGIGSYKLKLHEEELIGRLTDRIPNCQGLPIESPMLVARMIGDELEPTLKVTLWNARIEYRVPTLLALQKAFETSDQAGDVTSFSVATLQDQNPGQDDAVLTASRSSSMSRPLKLKVALRETAIGLNPMGSPAKALLLFQSADLDGGLSQNESTATSYALTIKKLSILMIDDATNIMHESDLKHDKLPATELINDAALSLQKAGFVSVCDISAAKVSVSSRTTSTEQSCVEIDIQDELLVLETCADSMQTLIAVFGGLSPPTPPSKDIKYRTQVVSMQDMLASFHGAEVPSEALMPEDEEFEYSDDDDEETISIGESFHDPDQALSERKLEGSEQYGLGSLTESQLLDPGKELRASGQSSAIKSSLMDESLVFDEEHFGNKLGEAGEKQRWNSSKNDFEVVNGPESPVYPFQLRIRDVHIIWNLFDGYDWTRTRDTISQAVANLEAKAAEAQAKRDRLRSLDDEEQEDPVIGDFLFNSIYIGVGVQQNPRDVAHGINRNIDDLISETASQTTGVTSPKSSSPSRFGGAKPRKQRLRLKRSRHHKMTFELKGISVDFTLRPPGSEETQSVVDVRVKDLDIFDHVPTSTWKKFATYMHDAGERESESNMVHVELLTVRPVPELDASEIVLRARVLPLRLHVDQDALDFLTRFFEFKAEPSDPDALPKDASEAPFIQRAEIAAIPVKLDFKPKRVDYAGLRSGRTTEFMNFIVLEGADMVLRRVIVYGICGFDRLGITLNDIWSPDVRSHQLRGVLAGLAPVRPLVNVGAGVRDLVVVPVREYRKDGRVMRAVQKGAVAFAKTTTTELAKLGVKLAVGTQTALQSAETALVPVQKVLGARSGAGAEEHEGDLDESMIDEEKPVFSPYSDPPIGVVQGLRGAYRQLERDLLLARDAVVAMPGEIIESGSASGAAKAVLRGAPTVILRPAMGVSKAVGQTLMGATASLDREQRRRIDDKYKKRG